MKAHIGVDAHSGLVHTVVGTAANVNDVTQAHALVPALASSQRQTRHRRCSARDGVIRHSGSELTRSRSILLGPTGADHDGKSCY